MSDIEQLDAELPVEPAKAAQWLLYAIVGFIAVGLVWAGTASLDRVTRGDGRVVPSNQLQEVQYLEGGIVKEILVAPGQEVEAGQVLVRIDPTQLNAEFLQGREGYNLLAARIARLEARAAGEALAFPEALAEVAPRIVADERKLYDARTEEKDAAIAVEEARLKEAEVAAETARTNLALAREELRMLRPLVKKGIEPQIELLRARRRESEANGTLEQASVAVTRAEGEIDNIRKRFAASVAEELTKAKADMAEISGDLPALQDKVARADLRAPIAGVVNRVLVATIGGVVKPGETIVEIVPKGDAPLIEARVKPADIGFLHVGQAARVKLTAYDSSRYGALDAVVEAISPDAILDEETGERYFEVKIRTNEDAVKTEKGEAPITPGMAAQVDILNGKRTVLAYIFKPIAEVGGKALRED